MTSSLMHVFCIILSRVNFGYLHTQRDGDTALHQGSAGGDVKTVQLLLRHNAVASMRNQMVGELVVCYHSMGYFQRCKFCNCMKIALDQLQIFAILL